METGIKKKVIATILRKGVRKMDTSYDWNDFANRNNILGDRTMALVLVDDETEKAFAREDFGIIKEHGRFVLKQFPKPVRQPTVMVFCTESMFLRIAMKETNPAKGIPWTPEDAFWMTPYFWLVGADYFRDQIIFNRLFNEVHGYIDELKEEVNGN